MRTIDYFSSEDLPNTDKLVLAGLGRRKNSSDEPCPWCEAGEQAEGCLDCFGQGIVLTDRETDVLRWLDGVEEIELLDLHIDHSLRRHALIFPDGPEPDLESIKLRIFRSLGWISSGPNKTDPPGETGSTATIKCASSGQNSL